MSFLIALLGLSFLIFIHELGHYLVAIAVGMKVEVFSIGFGKAIFSFQVKNVKWQIGSLPFGGYVKIAGMEKEGKLEPHQIPNGFYGKSPFKRILVALAGPFVNIAFALMVFFLLYFTGGRIQNFSNHTNIIGYVDPKSSLEKLGVKPGDELQEVDGRKISTFQDLLYSSVVKKNQVSLKGQSINYFNKTLVPFSIEAPLYKDLNVTNKDFKTTGIKSFAQYLIYSSQLQPKHLLDGSPLKDSGIQDQDRIVWVNGELIFSTQQLIDVINDDKVLLTVKRGEKYFLTRVPVISIADLRLNQLQREELVDYKHALEMQKSINEYRFIPYDIDPKGFVQSSLVFIDENAQQATVYNRKASQIDTLLKKGDRIIAVAGDKVNSAVAIFDQIQQKKAIIIVQKGSWSQVISGTNYDENFIDTYYPKELSQLISTIGLDGKAKFSGPYQVLKPVVPLAQRQLLYPKEEQMKIQKQLEEKIVSVEAAKDPNLKAVYVKQLKQFNEKLLLGAVFKDRQVYYNPSPWQQTKDVFLQTKTVFSYLFTGQISPKWLSGPVGIIQVVQTSVSYGFKEVLYWLAIISMNLAIFNLLPIPVLDGGHIVMSLYEGVTKKPIPSKVKEWIMIPFIVLFIGFFIFVTFHDLSRLFSWLWR